jgi:lipoyl(octanoyl) transferase
MPDGTGEARAREARPSSAAPRELWAVSLGRVPYGEALELQRAVARARIAGDVAQDVLLLVEHPPVVTLGRSTKGQHVTTPPALLAARGVELFEVERGGDVTFHGPGQLVGYPIVDLKRHRRDLHWYLRQVEEALIVALGELGIEAGRNPGLTGVWVMDEDGGSRVEGPGSRPAARDVPEPARPSTLDPRPSRKIASIGVHARDWVTWHGFALNVTTDLSYFDLIVPCGIAGVDMTSVARERRQAPTDVDSAAVEDAVVGAFGRVFDLTPARVAAHALPGAPALQEH